MQEYPFPSNLLTSSFPLINCLKRIECDVTGLYIVFENANILYVGMSLKIDRRISNIESTHHQLPTILKRHPFSRVHIIEFPWWELDISDDDLTLYQYIVTTALRGFESAAIQYYRPLYNRTS
ncbi:hypothetical protein NSS79_18205 [Paenibacillus sp. FSL L8-0436]|uniref:hypothetical protein n=1 Tax=Paenibacillus sp. FSL L8-0436 TaxID=2954686 RepID=UPI0031597E4B